MMGEFSLSLSLCMLYVLYMNEYVSVYVCKTQTGIKTTHAKS